GLNGNSIDRGDLVVGGSRIVAAEVLPPFFRYYRRLEILPGYGFDGLNRFPQYDRNELDFAAQGAPKEIAAPVALDFAHPGQELRFEHRLVGVGMCGRRLSMPNSSDHGSASSAGV